MNSKWIFRCFLKNLQIRVLMYYFKHLSYCRYFVLLSLVAWLLFRTVFTLFFLEFYFILFLYSRFLVVINFIHIGIYMSIPISQFIPPPPPPRTVFTLYAEKSECLEYVHIYIESLNIAMFLFQIMSLLALDFLIWYYRLFLCYWKRRLLR